MTGPWHLTDTIRRTQGYLVAAVALTVSWYGAASTTALSRQVVFVAVGLVAVGVAGSAECLWLLSGMRSIRDRRATLQLSLSALRTPVAAVTSGRVVVPGGTMSHDAGCPAVQGKKQTKVRRPDLRPCPLCTR
jgi:hypothetical protein